MKVIATLLDENEDFIETVLFESDDDYQVNGYLSLRDGGTYLIGEVKRGRPEAGTELTAIWIDGPRPEGPPIDGSDGVDQ
jgi:hypothetical protein